MLFFNTLQEPYYDRLMPTTTGSFANMIKMGNLVDHAIKNGRIDMGKSCSKRKRGSFAKKKEGEIQALYVKLVFLFRGKPAISIYVRKTSKF